MCLTLEDAQLGSIAMKRKNDVVICSNEVDQHVSTPSLRWLSKSQKLTNGEDSIIEAVYHGERGTLLIKNSLSQQRVLFSVLGKLILVLIAECVAESAP